MDAFDPSVLVSGGGIVAFAWVVYRQGEKIIEAIKGLTTAAAEIVERLARLETRQDVSAGELRRRTMRTPPKGVPAP